MMDESSQNLFRNRVQTAAVLLVMCLLAPGSLDSAFCQMSSQDRSAMAIGILDKASGAANEITDVHKREFALQKIAGAYAKVGQVKRGLEIASRMESEGSKSYAWRAIVSALAERGQVEEAVEVGKACPIESQKWGLISDVARIRGEAGDLDGVLHACTLIHNEVYDSRALVRVAEIRLARGDLNIARAALRHALTAASSISNAFAYSKTEALLSVASAEAALGDKDRARMICEMLIEAAAADTNDSHKSGILERTAGIQARTDGISNAFAIANTIKNEFCRGRAFKRIACAQAEAGKLQDALATLDLIKNEKWKLDNSVDVLAAAAAGGQAAKAVEMAKQLKDENRRLTALFQISLQQFRAGDQQGAKKTIENLLATTWGSTKVVENAFILEMVADLQMAIQDNNGARYSLRRAAELAAAYQHPNYSNDEALTQIAKNQVRAGDTSGASQTATRVKDDGWRNHALEPIAVALAEAGDYARALETAAGIDWEQSRATTLQRIASTQAAKGGARQVQAWAARQPTAIQKAHALLGLAEGIINAD